MMCGALGRSKKLGWAIAANLAEQINTASKASAAGREASEEPADRTPLTVLLKED